jgi:hypothetical protein
MKPLTREEVENPPGASYTTIDGLERGRVLALLDERDAAQADAARLTTARDNEWLRALETESVCCAPLTPRQIFDAVCTRDAKVRSEQAITDYEGYAALLLGAEVLPPPRGLAEALAERDTRVRIAALADAPFVAAAIEAARLKALEASAQAVIDTDIEVREDRERPTQVCHDDALATLRNAVENIRALKEQKPAPAKPCAACGGSGRRLEDHDGRAGYGPCHDCAEVRR